MGNFTDWPHISSACGYFRAIGTGRIKPGSAGRVRFPGSPGVLYESNLCRRKAISCVFGPWPAVKAAAAAAENYSNTKTMA